MPSRRFGSVWNPWLLVGCSRGGTGDDHGRNHAWWGRVSWCSLLSVWSALPADLDVRQSVSHLSYPVLRLAIRVPRRLRGNDDAATIHQITEDDDAVDKQPVYFRK
jgi:hypothetical protein